ncbi:MAG TPA: hypothetical protein VF521_10850, partial [Pyrinomonadaceae bacterium]
LLERAAKLSEDAGGGSLTALPVIETKAGDISAYIPTNVISITDGQIFLEADLFNSGIRPAINVGNSVSRVGGSARIKAMKQVAGTLRLDLAQYRELAAFAQFGSDLDQATQRQLARGQRLVEILKQPQYRPMDVEKQVLILWAATSGQLDDIPVDQVRRFEGDFIHFVETSQPGIINGIREKKAITDEIKQELVAAVGDFKPTWQERGFNPQPDPTKATTTAAAGA